MQILVKTPFINHNKYLPHLLEHCLSIKSDTLGFLESLHIDAYTASGYSGYESSTFSITDLSNLLQTTPTLENFAHQKRILKSEFAQIFYGQRVYEKVLQKCLNTNIITNKSTEVSFEELISYHQERYQLHNMIAVDNQWTLLLDRGKGENLKHHQPTLEDFQFPSYHAFSYQREKQEILIAKQGSPTTILVLDFFADFFDTLTDYMVYQKGEYSSTSLDLSLTDSAFIIAKDEQYHKIPLQKAQDFFPIFQTFYLSEIAHNRKRAYIPHIALLYESYIAQHQHIALIKTIDRSLIAQLLQQFHCLKHER